jgi:hypothetical protein
MIDVLYNKLGSINDSKSGNAIASAEWKDIDVLIYNRHSQQLAQLPQLPQLPLLKEVKETKSVKCLPKVTESIITEPSPLKQTLTQFAQHVPLTNAPVAPVATATATDPASSKKKEDAITKGKKDTTIKPLDIIMKETTSFNISTEYIKDSIITLISKEEFSKVFGLTKCSEIMSGVVNNRWNKSTALFISFLFDREVYYNDKIILYNKDNKDKNGGVITI